MGKKSIALNIKNRELKNTTTFLLCGSGYFNVVELGNEFNQLGEKPEHKSEVKIISDNDIDYVNNSFPVFLSNLLLELDIQCKGKDEGFSNANVKVVTIGSSIHTAQLSELIYALMEKMFEANQSYLFASLASCNTYLKSLVKNEKGFERWLVDSRRQTMGPLDKYTVQEMGGYSIGSPILNSHAGDVEMGDVDNLIKVMEPEGLNHLMLSVENSMDLERKKIYKRANISFFLMDGDSDLESQETLRLNYFDNAYPVIFREGKISESVNEIMDLILGDELDG